MFGQLRHLKTIGYKPDTVLDIGAHRGAWTMDMQNIYPDAKYYLFEPTNYSELNRFKNDNNVIVFNALLNEKIEEVEWYSIMGTGDSFFKEKSNHYATSKPTKRMTIDLNTLVIQNNILTDASNILIKIDCQGAEMPILKGATNIFEKTDFIILEMPLFGSYNQGVPSFLEHLVYMDSIGFVPFDVLENHRINGFNMQVDVLFINVNHEFNQLVNKLLL